MTLKNKNALFHFKPHFRSRVPLILTPNGGNHPHQTETKQNKKQTNKQNKNVNDQNSDYVFRHILIIRKSSMVSSKLKLFQHWKKVQV